MDTSTAASAACVLRTDGEAFELAPDPRSLERAPAHARELMPALADVMGRAGLVWDDLRAIAVGIGPGTFTGLRIGLATARGLAAGAGLPLRPVPSLAALAEGIEGKLRLAAIDAKRGELFAALYEQSEDGLAARFGPVAARPEVLAQRATAAGPGVMAAGDGSVRFREVLEAAGIHVAPDGAGAHVVRALHVCRLAQGVPDRPPEAVLPLYVREPDAKPQ